MRMNNVGMGQTTRHLGLAVHQFLQQMHGVGWILVLKIQFALNDVGNVVADVGLGVGFKQLVAQQAHGQYPLFAQFQNQGRVEGVGDVLVFMPDTLVIFDGESDGEAVYFKNTEAVDSYLSPAAASTTA